MLRASIVLPTPGTSSISACPLAHQRDNPQLNRPILADNDALNIIHNKLSDPPRRLNLLNQ